MVHNLEFTFERATKNTYRYQEQAPEGAEPHNWTPVVGALYVQKRDLPTKPVRIKVTIEEVLPVSA